MPPNASAFEHAVEETGAARLPLPVEQVSAVLDPDRCPEHLLPFLAWHLSLDIWDDRWPVEKKRHVCRHAFALLRLKTTPAGIRQHVALTGAEVTKITRPPARGFLRGAMSEAQRLSWLESLPQIRIYPFLTRETARPGQIFLSGATGTRFWRGALRASRGDRLLGRYATYYDRGKEQRVTLASQTGDSVQRINIARSGVARAFWSHGFHGSFHLSVSTAETHVLSVRPQTEGTQFAVPAGSQPTDVSPRRVARRRTVFTPRAFWRRRTRFHGRGYLRESFAPHLVYDVYYLIDRNRTGPRQQAVSWHGHGQYGIDPFTAKLRISVALHRPRARTHRWHGNGYLRAASMERLAQAIAAVRVSKALRDTIFIDTTTHRRVQFASGLRFGDFTFGQIRKAH
nr:phage tail protein I [Altericroceibacterium endophyticum]